MSNRIYQYGPCMNPSRRGFLIGGLAGLVASPAVVRAASLMPVSVPRLVGVDRPRWLVPDGRLVSKFDYPELFAQIGTTYGTGDGATTFNLPDLRGVGLGRLMSAVTQPRNIPVGYVLDSKTGMFILKAMG